jgi:hypothetical protein
MAAEAKYRPPMMATAAMIRMYQSRSFVMTPESMVQSSPSRWHEPDDERLAAPPLAG